MGSKPKNKYLLLDLLSERMTDELYLGILTGEQVRILAVRKFLPHLVKDPDMLAHFTNEARRASLLQHKNIAAVCDYGKIDGTFFIANEYFLGKNLDQIRIKLKENGQYLAPDIALQILEQICSGMDYAHNLKDISGNSFNLLHGGLTPQNILVTYEGEVKILNFGVIRDNIIDNPSEDETGIAYMSPEQVMGGELDCRSDIFAMGILFYEMLSGIRFYNGGTSEIIQKAVRADFQPLKGIIPDLPDDIYALAAKAVDCRPEARYQNCRELAADIENCRNQLENNNSSISRFMQQLFAVEYQAERQVISKILQQHTHTQQPGLKKQLKGDKMDLPKKRRQETRKYAQIGIENIRGAAKKRLRKKDDIFRIVQSAGLALAAVALITVGVYYFRNHPEKELPDYFMQAAPPKWQKLDLAAMTQKEKDFLLFTLNIKSGGALDEGRLISPADKNAFVYINQARSVAPENKEVLGNLERLVQQLEQRAELAVQQGENNKAAKFITAGLAIAPDNQKLIAMKQKLIDGH
ncbi:MAG: hypothetical protein CSB24_01635 [Deltaproteobacteria bacterium]|nr:MAG: hypothetical protein CSB24_01635 [Deltaproteobacteria bacterium]